MKRKIFYIPLIIYIFIHGINALSQVSALQSKAGESSVLINGGGIFINTADASISSSFSFGKSDGKKTDFFGVNLKFKSTEGVTTLLDGGKFKAEWEGSGYWMHGFNSTDAVDSPTSSFIYVLLGYKRAKYNILQNSASTEFNSKVFDGLNLTGGYNRFSAIDKTLFLFGTSLTLGSFNNIETLSPVQRNSINTGTVNGQLINVLKDKKGGFEGNYLSSFGSRLSFDSYLYPPIFDKQNVGIGGYGRAFWGKEFSKSNVGLGIVVGNPTASDVIVLGLFYQFQNVFRETSAGVSQTVSLTAGYNF